MLALGSIKLCCGMREFVRKSMPLTNLFLVGHNLVTSSVFPPLDQFLSLGNQKKSKGDDTKDFCGKNVPKCKVF